VQAAAVIQCSQTKTVLRIELLIHTFLYFHVLVIVTKLSGLPWLYNAVIWTTYQNQLSYSLKVTLVFFVGRRLQWV
jgi:hypothetical protein